MLECSIISQPDDCSALNSPAKKQWHTLCLTCTTFSQILWHCSNPFQQFALSFDTRIEQQDITLRRLQMWTQLIDSLLSSKSFKLTFTVSFDKANIYSHDIVKSVFTQLQKDRVLCALDSISIKLAPGYYGGNQLPLLLPNVTHLYMKVRDYNVQGQRNSAAFIINCPCIADLSINSNSPTMQ